MGIPQVLPPNLFPVDKSLASCPSPVLTLLALTSPLLWGLALQLHSAVTGSYIPGTHSIALVTCLNEQIARDIARYFWKGELEESTEILAGQGAEPPAGLTPLLRASFRFRSIHPFEIPDIVSLPIHQGNPLYLRWIGENVPSGTTTLPCVPIPT
uniref:Protein CutA n=1 Tax=Cyanoderma ruficeps TaxID=181631 RepID=A0A8C3P2N5_9PASS